MFWLFVAIIAVVSYLLGGANGAIIASTTFFKKDIREFGSKNAGLTNFFRVFGTKGVVVVLLIDIAKAAAAVLLGWWLLGSYFELPMLGKLIAGLFVILGHAFPVYYRFKGGKGILSAGILVLMVDWRVGLIVWGVFLLTVLLTRYVSLGSILGTIAFPTSMALLGCTWYEVLIASACAVIAILRHGSNIARLIKGKESKLSFKKKAQ